MFLAILGVTAAAQPADTLFVNGHIQTVDGNWSWVTNLAVVDGKIVASGNDLDAWRGPETRVIDLQGHTVLPGFTDAHVHLILGGLEHSRCVLNDCRTIEQLQQTIKIYALNNPDEAWILGAGWSPTLFAAEGPNRQVLDRLVPDRPAFLYSSDGHSAWANSRALQLSGVTADSENPAGGEIVTASGEPTGALKESATGLVEAHTPQPSAEDYARHFAVAQTEAHRVGLTAVYEANTNETMLQAYQLLDRRRQLQLRVAAALETEADTTAEQLVRLRDLYSGGRLRVVGAKIFADGVIESGTAALLTPAVGAGSMDFLLSKGKEHWREWALAGFQLHFHAIGDGAVRAALDTIAGLPDPAKGRHHIAHLQLVAKSDFDRFRSLGVWANIQALWAFPDECMTGLTQPKLSIEQNLRMYPFGSLARHGARFVCGSDWTVSSLNPFEAIEVAVTRRDPITNRGPALLPGQALSVRQMVEGYTKNGAYITFQESSRGTLEVGKVADFIVLDQDIFAVESEKISDTKVLATYLEGKQVYP